jgi:hypothetical protein
MRRLQITDASLMRITVKQEILRPGESHYNHIVTPRHGKTPAEQLRQHYAAAPGISLWQRIFKLMGFGDRKQRVKMAQFDTDVHGSMKKNN